MEVKILLLLITAVHSSDSWDWTDNYPTENKSWFTDKDNQKSPHAKKPHEYSCKPEQVHLSFGDSVTEVNIVWATKDICIGRVKYGSHPWGFNKTVPSDYAHFTEHNAKGAQHLYRAKLQNLLPETTYYYIPITNESSTGPFYFETPKAGNDWPANFLMFGDLGIHAGTIPSLTSEALSGKYTAIFHVGDFAYDLHNDDGGLGDYFMKLIEPIATSVPYMTCPGNHEINEDTFTHYRHRFAMPGSDWPIPVNKLWYSIDIGPVHFVSYSSEVFFTHYGYYVDQQKRWLERDLGAAITNREQTPWIVAFGHRPMYCSTRIGDDCSKSDSYVRAGLEDVFYKYSVDLVIQAHEHNYERLWPQYKGKVLNHTYDSPAVPVQIITGAAGSEEGADHFESSYRPSWSAFRLDDKSMNSYGRLLVFNATHIFWEQRSIVSHSALDSIWLTKEMNGTNSTLPRDTPHITNYNIVAFIVCLVGLAVILPLFGYYILRRLRKNRYTSSLQANNYAESDRLEILSDESDDDFA